MPAYFFHIVFELSPSRPSTTAPAFHPPPLTDIFRSELPVHKTTSWASFAPSTRHKLDKLELHHRPVLRERLSSFQRPGRRRQPSVGSPGDSPVPPTKGPSKHKRAQSFALKDWRFDTICIQSIDMVQGSVDEAAKPRAIKLNDPSRVTSTSVGLATKGRFVPSDIRDTEVGWGVVHLYREGQETPGLYDDHIPTGGNEGVDNHHLEEDCTTLCILAVPSYMTPSDFLGFVGEQTREDVSHFRLIRTSRANKYMVLMKFREARSAREWRKAWNGKPFNSMEVR